MFLVWLPGNDLHDRSPSGCFYKLGLLVVGVFGFASRAPSVLEAPKLVPCYDLGPRLDVMEASGLRAASRPLACEGRLRVKIGGPGVVVNEDIITLTIQNPLFVGSL